MTCYGSPRPKVLTWWWLAPSSPCRWGWWTSCSGAASRSLALRRKAALLESSKAFAKRFMQRHQIPTAAYAVATSEQQAMESIDLFHLPVVIKADGLASGKGVIMCETRREATEAISGMLGGKLLGSAQSSIVIEEFLTGEEISFLTLTDGKHVVPLAPAQDHKRIGEGDKGPNTGGMGAYSTDGMVDDQMRDWILNHIALPAVSGMAAEDAPFVGVLYIGLMMTARGPMVLEFNARFGDPETQAILARLDSDLVAALEACVEGRLSDTELRVEARSLRVCDRGLGRLPRQLRHRAQDQRPGRSGPRAGSRDFSFRHRPGRRALRHRRRKGARRDRGGRDPGPIAVAGLRGPGPNPIRGHVLPPGHRAPVAKERLVPPSARGLRALRALRAHSFYGLSPRILRAPRTL